jgi:hypothetical protein
MQDQAEYNLWFRQMMAKHCPELFDDVRNETHEGIEYLIGVIDDSRGDRYRVAVSTFGCELTVFCHAWHSHFDQFSDDEHESEFFDAVDWIRQFRADEIVIFTEYEGDRVVYATAAEPTFQFRPSHGRRAKVFSFTGKLDRTIEA